MIAERRVSVGGAGTRYLEVEGAAPEHPVLWVHGNPSSADDWAQFLSALEGQRRCLAPDLIGWGKSDRLPAFPHTIDGLATFIEGFLDELGVHRFDLVVHDWGGLGLWAAQRRPEAVDRVVIMNAVPLTSTYRWHWIAQLWRRRGLGELLNATTSRPGTRQLLRQAVVRKEAIPELADQIHEHFDRGTKRAVLQLYRDADPERLEERGRDLHKLTGPGLVVWGDRDPYIDSSFADYYASTLGGEVRVEHIPDAGHWPWVDRPDVVETVAGFLRAGP
jgi:pimeloyl-ACP methyl ester carboxylesterase